MIAQQQLFSTDEFTGAYCPHCGESYTKGDEPDPCIGRLLPGIYGCCCGHGEISRAYADPDAGWAEGIRTLGRPGHWDREKWWPILERHRLRGEAAIAFFAQHGCGPGSPKTSVPAARRPT